MHRYSFCLLLLLVALMVRFSAPVSAGDKDKKEPDKGEKAEEKKPYLLVVPPAGGKEVKVDDWRFVAGTRRLALTGDVPITPKGKTPTGPEFLEFREEKSTTYKNGIFTFIPLASIKKMDFDREKKTVSTVVIKDGGEETTLVGNTKFASNKITIEVEGPLKGLDGLGNASLKIHGGTDKGIQSVAFPTPKQAEKVKGPTAVIVADDKEKTKHTVFDVQPVFLVDGQYRLMPYMMFKKAEKIEWDKLASLTFAPSKDKKKLSTDYEVTLKDGTKQTLSILTAVELEKKKVMTFVGLIGRVPVGYKLFMLDAIYEYHAAAEDEKKK